LGKPSDDTEVIDGGVPSMTQRTVRIVSFVVPLLLMAYFSPWNAHSDQEFATAAERVLLIAVLVHFALRYGLPQLGLGTESEPRTSREKSSGLSGWGLVRIAGVISLAVGLACVVLTTNHMLAVDLGFFFEVIAQQLTLLVIAHYVTKLPNGNPSQIACLLALVGMAVFFAWSSNIVFLAQKPPRAPMSSDAANILYAVPAVSLIALSVTRRLLRR
jgi:hypothetical protein